MSLLGELIGQALQNVTALRRLAAKASVSLNDGLGTYLLSMVCLAIACTFAWHARTAGVPDDARLNKLEDLIPQQQEPLRDERSLFFSGSVLLGLEDWNLCEAIEKDGSGATAMASHLADESARLFGEFYRAPQPPTQDLGAWFATEFPLLTAMRAPVARGWPAESKPHFHQDLDTSTSYKTDRVGHAEVWKGLVSMTRVPSQVHSANIQAPRYQMAYKRLSRESLTAWFSWLVGRQATAALPAIAAAYPNPATLDTSLPEFKAFYFISLDGLFQITPPPDEYLSPHQLFHHRSYVTAILSGDLRGACTADGSRYHSRPYLDMVGEGVVSTVCYPVIADPLPPAPLSQAKPLGATARVSSPPPCAAPSPSGADGGTGSVVVLDGGSPEVLDRGAPDVPDGGAYARQARTPSSRVERPRAEASGSSLPAGTHQHPQGLAGVFCIDVAPPRDEIRGGLADNPIFKTRLVRITYTGQAGGSGAEPEVAVCGDRPEDFDCGRHKARLGPDSDADREQTVQLAGEFFKRRAEHPRDARDGKVFRLPDVSPDEPWLGLPFLKGPEPIYYGVRLWNSSSNTPRIEEVAILEVARSDRRALLYWGGCIASMLFVTYLIGASRLSQGKIRESAMMRNLQTGVLRLRIDAHGQERLIGANDRAEELLGIELPRLGIADSVFSRPSRAPIFFQQLMASRHIAQLSALEQKEEDALWMDGVWFRLVWMKFPRLMDERRQGIHSSYFALLHAGGHPQWFKISGTPIRMPKGLLETFSLFEPVLDENITRRLNDELKKREDGS